MEIITSFWKEISLVTKMLSGIGAIIIAMLSVRLNLLKSKKIKIDIDKNTSISTNETIAKGIFSKSREHYMVANSLLEKGEIKTIFLCQKSSTFLLGPVEFCDLELTFYKNLQIILQRNIEFFHIVSITKTKMTLKDKAKSFTLTKEAHQTLLSLSGKHVAIKIGANKFSPIRIIENENNFKDLASFSPYLFVEYKDGNTHGLFISKVGTSSMSIHLVGPMVSELMQDSIRLFQHSKFLSNQDFNSVFEPNVEIKQ